MHRLLIILLFVVGFTANGERHIERSFDYRFGSDIVDDYNFSGDLVNKKFIHELNNAKSKEESEEAIRCKIELESNRGSVKLSCWFCNCDDLAEAARQHLETLDLEF